MEVLRTFFEVNRQIILFVYGLVFFVLGLGIALQSRRYSRLDLARSLSWLAAFGFTHSLQEWGDLFIPIQRAYLSPALIQFMWRVQLVLLAVSFVCLFEFGVSLLRPLGYARWWHGLSAGLFLGWTVVSFGVLPTLTTDAKQWHFIANAIARYAIAFPGGLLAAYGLRKQTLHRIAPLNVPTIYNTFRSVGWLLMLYAVFGGLIPPPVPFFPGNWLNATTFEQTLGIPPLVIRSLIGLLLAVMVIRALEVFEVETARMIETMEQQQILAAERLRLGRELHDGAIQMVYTAGLLVESAQKLAVPESALAARLEKAMSVLNAAIRDLRRNLDELRAPTAAVPLAAVLQEVAADPRLRSLVSLTLNLEVPPTVALAPHRTDHLRAILAEALANVMRHAQAQRVVLAAHCAHGQLHLTLQDDGVGFPPETHAGYGLRNMRDRAQLLSGTLEITRAADKGTRVQLQIPVEG